MSPPRWTKTKKSEKEKIEKLPDPPSFKDKSPPIYSTPIISSHPSFLPPLPPPENILQRSPIPEPFTKPPLEDKESFQHLDSVTNEILNELRKTDFGSFLQTVPVEKETKISPDEINKKYYEDAKSAYLSAGHKHIELNFYENAARNFSCAILCAFLGESVFEAAHLAAELAPSLPMAVLDSSSMQGVKFLLKANLLQSKSLLKQAETWLFRNKHYLYKEDEELIIRAIKHSEIEITEKKKAT
ncbi:MAG: hypothetical protein ACTSW1_09725 [Candidatus Hodarchaeales archaeon]